jgi:hypothetical protein
VSNGTHWPTKDGVLLGMVLLLSVLLALDTGAIWRLESLITSQSELAQQGGESHAALCQLRASEEQQIAQSQLFLSLTHKQLVVRYGTAIADIPRSTILSGIQRQEAAVKALRLTEC